MFLLTSPGEPLLGWRESGGKRRNVHIQSIVKHAEISLETESMVVDTIVKKYCDHLPLYRQEQILAREAGVEISRTTMDGWVMQVGEMLLPVREATRRGLFTSTYLQADETTVPVQTGQRTGKNHEAYLWQFGRPRRSGIRVRDGTRSRCGG